MSATIVDILYKPNHNDIICSTSPECTFINENSFQLPLREDKLEMLVKNNPSFNVSVTDNNNVPKVSISKKNKFTVMLKDTEENDSGVYFSDTKSSPENVNPIWRNTCPEKYNLDRDTHGISITSKCLHNSDSSDNNQTENLGPQNFTDNKFCQMLDNFEAQTVSAFREDILNRFETCENLYEKHHAFEDWLDVGARKNKRENSLSEYLKCMLQTEESNDASSFQFLNVVEEDDRCNNNTGSKVADETVKTINVFRNSDSNLEATSIDDSQIVDFTVENNNNVFVNNLFVNNDDVYNSQCLDLSDNIVKSVEDNFICNESKIFENECSDDYLNISKNITEFNFKPFTDELNLTDNDKNINIKALNSPHIETGTVKSLINIFENIKCAEPPFYPPDELNEITEYILPPPISFLDNIDQNSNHENDSLKVEEFIIPVETEDQLCTFEEFKKEVIPHVIDNFNEEQEPTLKEIYKSQNIYERKDFKISELKSPELFSLKITCKDEIKVPTRIPIVVLNQINHSEESYSDHPVGMVELHPCEEDSVLAGEDDYRTDLYEAVSDCIAPTDSYSVENNEVYEVILEKVWDSLGIQIEECEDEEDYTGQILISNILPGGAADSSGLITKGAQ